jgi:hypothetical protein
VPITQAGDDLHQMVFFAVRVGGEVGRYGLHAGSRVAFVPEIGGGSEFGVLGYLLVEKIIGVRSIVTLYSSVMTLEMARLAPGHSVPSAPDTMGYEASLEPTWIALMALNGPRSFSASAAGPAYSKPHCSTAWS